MKQPLGNLAKFVSGGTPSKQNPAFWGGDTPWVSAKDLKSLRISKSIETLSDEGRKAASLVPKGTILFLVRGMSLFKTIPLGVADRELAINQDVKGLVSLNGVSSLFLTYSLLAQTEKLLQMVEAAGHGTGRLDTDALKELLIWVPSKNEQTRIVEILSVWDTAIEKTEQLIAAKEQRLRGLQRKFLRNQVWEQVPISKLFSEVKRQDEDASIPVATISAGKGFLTQEERFNRVLAGKNLANYTILQKGEFAYNKGSSKTYEFGCVYLLQEPERLAIPNVYVSFSPKVKLSSEFYALWFEADMLKPQLRRVVNSGVRNDGLLNINAKSFFKLKVPAPPVNEQKQIARVLGSVKKEIALLKQQREALQTQKRGLMQKLLTGQWRVGGKS